jgi:hypothetical protein
MVPLKFLLNTSKNIVVFEKSALRSIPGLFLKVTAFSTYPDPDLGLMAHLITCSECTVASTGTVF